MPKKKKPYRSKIKIGVDADGKPVNKYYQGRTRAELDQARDAIIARYITGEALADDRLFGDYATEWFRVRKAPFVSASTRESYRTALNKHLLPVLGDRMLRAITPLELQELLKYLRGQVQVADHQHPCRAARRLRLRHGRQDRLPRPLPSA